MQLYQYRKDTFGGPLGHLSDDNPSPEQPHSSQREHGHPQHENGDSDYRADVLSARLSLEESHVSVDVLSRVQGCEVTRGGEWWALSDVIPNVRVTLGRDWCGAVHSVRLLSAYPPDSPA